MFLSLVVAPESANDTRVVEWHFNLDLFFLSFSSWFLLLFTFRFLEFGIDSVADALDPFITNDETLTDEIGMNAEETAAFHKQCKVARALTAAF